MKFGIKKEGETYKWNLYELSTQKIDGELYFPLSQPHYFLNEKEITVSPQTDITLLGALDIQGIYGEFDQLSCNLLKNLNDFITKEEPFQLDKEYFINQFENSFTLKERVLKAGDKYHKLITKFKFFRKTALLKADSEKEEPIYVFFDEDSQLVVFIKPQ